MVDENVTLNPFLLSGGISHVLLRRMQRQGIPLSSDHQVSTDRFVGDPVACVDLPCSSVGLAGRLRESFWPSQDNGRVTSAVWRGVPLGERNARLARAHGHRVSMRVAACAASARQNGWVSVPTHASKKTSKNINKECAQDSTTSCGMSGLVIHGGHALDQAGH